MFAKDIMTTDLITLDMNSTCGEASQKMRDFNIGDVLIKNGDSLDGIITDRDIAVRCIAENMNPWETFLSDIATLDPLTATPQTPIHDCSEIMSQNQVRRLPIIENDQLVGIVSLGDLAVDAPVESDIEEVLEEISVPTR